MQREQPALRVLGLRLVAASMDSMQITPSSSAPRDNDGHTGSDLVAVLGDRLTTFPLTPAVRIALCELLCGSTWAQVGTERIISEPCWTASAAMPAANQPPPPQRSRLGASTSMALKPTPSALCAADGVWGPGAPASHRAAGGRVPAAAACGCQRRRGGAQGHARPAVRPGLWSSQRRDAPGRARVAGTAAGCAQTRGSRRHGAAGSRGEKGGTGSTAG